MTESALIVAEKMDAAVLFTDTGMEKTLNSIREMAMAHVPDISTDQGRKDIASLAHRVARSKTLIDDMGKDKIADAKKVIDGVNPLRKKARDFLDNLKAEVRKPLDDWEAEEAAKKAEADRIERERIEKRISELAKYGQNLPFFDVAGWDDAKYSEVLQSAKEKHEAEQKRLAEEEAARKMEAEHLEKVRKEQEAEAARLAEEKRKQDELNRIEREKIEAEKRAIENEKAAIQKEKDIREAAAVARNLAILEEKEAQARKEREAKEKAEKEEAEKIRRENMRPDKEKLEAWAKMIADTPLPELQNPNIVAIAKEARTQLFRVAQNIINAIKRLK
uniref:Uncharacterized protein n=1 Tax=viral metagenome TaxID=1070528 RepID=A0A6M3IG13_9ZZZZ